MNWMLRWQWVRAFGLGVALLLTVGCGGSDDSDSETPRSEASSGGEDVTSSSSRPSSWDSTSSDDDDDDWDGDIDEAPEPEPEPAAVAEAEQAAEEAAEEEETQPAVNPWGATREEQCRRPERRAVSANAMASIRRGVQAARTGDVAGATRAFQQAVGMDRFAYPAVYNLGVMADRAGNSGQAMEYYRQALEILPDYEDAARGIVALHYRRGSVSDAVAFVQPLARRFPTNLHIQALHAEVLARAERYDQAWQAGRRALRCDERFVPALTALVRASLAQGRRELAERILEQALEIETDNAELHYLKAGLLVDVPGRLRDAIEEYRRTISLDPDHAEARMSLGILMLTGGSYAEALDHFQRVARLTPNEAAVHLNLGDAYRALSQWENAKRAFDRALAAEPNLAQAHFNLALMYMTAGADYPGLDLLSSMQRAVQEFTRYRDMMGPRLGREDPSEGYMRTLDRQIRREQRRIENEEAERQREAERAARGEDGSAEDEYMEEDYE